MRSTSLSGNGADSKSEASPSFFLTWNWIGALLETVPADARPHLLRGTADGRTVALAVLGDAQIRRHRMGPGTPLDSQCHRRSATGLHLP